MGKEEAITEVKVAASLWLAAAKKAKRPIPEPADFHRSRISPSVATPAFGWESN